MVNQELTSRESSQVVSVALCTWNGKQWIGSQLRSILLQTRPVDEIVIFDDRSTDETCEIIRRIIADSKAKCKLHINEVNCGSSRNFQAALEACSGDIIFFADQDDIWHPNKVSTILHEFESSTEIGWVFSDLSLVDENGVPLGKTMWNRIGFGKTRLCRFQQGEQLAELLRRPIVTGASLAIRSRWVKLLTPFREHWVHDHWISLALAANQIKGKAIPNALMDYRIHPRQQIGDRQAGIVAQVQAVSKVKGENYRTEADELEKFYRSLIPTQDSCPKLIQTKAEHFRARANLQEMPRMLRILPILIELFRGNYRYSWSYFAPIRDLLK